MVDDNIKDLPPEERIKKLKHLEEKNKKEIEEAQNLIKQSENELTERRKWKEKVPIPEFASEELQGLSAEAKEILKLHKGLKEAHTASEEETKKKVQSIEKTIQRTTAGKDLEALAGGKINLPPEIINSEYALHLSREPMRDIYREMTEINRAVEDKGYINREEERRVEYLSSAVERKLEAGEEGSYSFTESAAMAANITQQLGTKLMSAYKRRNEGMYRGN